MLKFITKMYNKAVVTISLKINETALPNETSYSEQMLPQCHLWRKTESVKSSFVWIRRLGRTECWSDKDKCLNVSACESDGEPLVRTSEGVLRDLCENVWAICQIFHCCCVVDSFELFAGRTPYQIVIHVSWARNEHKVTASEHWLHYQTSYSNSV